MAPGVYFLIFQVLFTEIEESGIIFVKFISLFLVYIVLVVD